TIPASPLDGRTPRRWGIDWITLVSAGGFFGLFTFPGETMTLWKTLRSPCIAMVYLEGEEENAGEQILTSLQAELAEEEQVESVSRWDSSEGLILSLSQASFLTILEIRAEEPGFCVEGWSLTSDGWVKLETDEWENTKEKICSLMFLGLLFLVFSMALFRYYKSVWRLQEREAIEALQMMGWSTGRMRLFSVCRGSWFVGRALFVGGCLYYLCVSMKLWAV
ncbi:MAG: hypothetical protein LUC27_06265, partial [Lachnospiraceae bacterium]|nr:hypothetical protein [Lachnospiraceae bacterium]